MRPLAITSINRFPILPDVPTCVELGFADLIVDAWYGMYVPKGMPEDITARLVAEVSAIRQDEAVVSQLLDQFTFNASGTDEPAQFRAYMEAVEPLPGGRAVGRTGEGIVVSAPPALEGVETAREERHQCNHAISRGGAALVVFGLAGAAYAACITIWER